MGFFVNLFNIYVSIMPSQVNFIYSPILLIGALSFLHTTPSILRRSSRIIQKKKRKNLKEEQPTMHQSTEFSSASSATLENSENVHVGALIRLSGIVYRKGNDFQ